MPYFSSLLRTCISSSKFHQVKQTHAQILTSGFISKVSLQTDLILAYSKCSRVHDGRKVFDLMSKRGMYSWNIMISAFVVDSRFRDALCVFKELVDAGVWPDHFTFPSVFKACGSNVGSVSVGGCYMVGKMVHDWVVKLGFESHVIVGCSMLDFYVKNEDLRVAYRVFKGMARKDVVAWNSMIGGFVKCGLSAEALSCYREMLGDGVEMNSKTVPCVLSVCAREGNVMKGKEVHGYVLKCRGFDVDVVIENSLIDMYAKCGSLEYSEKVFGSMGNLSVVSWTTLISCYGVHGKGEKALGLFEKMIVSGLKPNCVTFTVVLASCSHSGLIDQGRRVFSSISLDYGIEPSVEHYACMVDLLGRFGHLEEAFELVKKMPENPPASVWGALLGACIIHKNVDIGEAAAYQLFNLEVGNSSNYIALCNIYEAVGKWDDVLRVRSKMREMGLLKNAACSWIPVKDEVHKFYHGDVSHADTKLVCQALDETSKEYSSVEL